MAVKNLQVTIGAAATQFTTDSIRCNWFAACNRAAHAMAVGGPDSAVGDSEPGIPVSVGGNFYQNRPYMAQMNLADWTVAGTENDVLSVVYDDGVDNRP